MAGVIVASFSNFPFFLILSFDQYASAEEVVIDSV